MRFLTAVTLVAAAFSTLAAPGAAKPPAEWDGLVRVEGKRVDLLYLRPDASLTSYSKVMLDPPLVAYDKQWRRDYDRSVTGFISRLTDREIRSMIDEAQQMLSHAYGKALTKVGYELVSAPDTDVLRLSIAVLNVRITAPEDSTAVRMTTISEDVGAATLVLEARDSLSGQLLGRAVDQEVLGDSIPMPRTDTSNRGDFQTLFEDWAKTSARGLVALKSALPPR